MSNRVVGPVSATGLGVRSLFAMAGIPISVFPMVLAAGTILA